MIYEGHIPLANPLITDLSGNFLVELIIPMFWRDNPFYQSKYLAFSSRRSPFLCTFSSSLTNSIIHYSNSTKSTPQSILMPTSSSFEGRIFELTVYTTFVGSSLPSGSFDPKRLGDTCVYGGPFVPSRYQLLSGNFSRSVSSPPLF